MSSKEESSSASGSVESVQRASRTTSEATETSTSATRTTSTSTTAPSATGSSSSSSTKKVGTKKTAALGLLQVLTGNEEWPHDMNLWALDVLDGYRDGHYAIDYTGSGVNVYVLSTGTRAMNTEYRSRVKALWEAPGIDNSAADCHGVGSHFAGLVTGTTTGVAKNSTVHMLRVVGCESALAAALAKNAASALEFLETAVVPPAVLVLALPPTTDAPTSSERSALAAALGRFIQRVNVTVVAAPFENQSSLTTCAMLREAADASGDASKSSIVAAGALTKDLTPLSASPSDANSQSNPIPPCVNYLAPGEAVWSTSNTSSFVASSGTLPAVSIAAGVASLVLEARPKSSAAEVFKLLRQVSQISARVDGSGVSGRNVTLMQSPLSKNTSSTLARRSKGKEVSLRLSDSSKQGSTPVSTENSKEGEGDAGGLTALSIVMIVFGSLVLVALLVISAVLFRVYAKPRLAAWLASRRSKLATKKGDVEAADGARNNELPPRYSYDEGSLHGADPDSAYHNYPENDMDYGYERGSRYSYDSYAASHHQHGVGSVRFDHNDQYHAHGQREKVASTVFYPPPMAHHAQSVYIPGDDQHDSENEGHRDNIGNRRDAANAYDDSTVDDIRNDARAPPQRQQPAYLGGKKGVAAVNKR